MNSMLPHASWVEVLQLVLAIVGVAVTFWRLWVALENGLLITQDDSNSLRRLVAETQVLSELFRLFAQGALVFVGVISVLLAPPDFGVPEASGELLQAQLVRFGLITLTISMVVDSLLQEKRRRDFLAHVRVAFGPPPPDMQITTAVEHVTRAGGGDVDGV